MEAVRSVVFRKITDADFFNINKSPGTEARGGGQSYIDVSTSGVSLGQWRKFFKGLKEEAGRSGRIWKAEVLSLGTTRGPQKVTIAQRRTTSVSIRSQKLYSKESNRVFAWRSDLTGFPNLPDPKERIRIYGLHVYLAKLGNGKIWAGWFQASQPDPDWPVNKKLNLMFSEPEGYLEFKGDVQFDEVDAEWPFRVEKDSPDLPEPTIPKASQGEEDPQLKTLFDEDEEGVENKPPKFKEAVRRIRVRNTKAVKKLKQLYDNLCQVTGTTFTFKKVNGEYYSEAHHLIPLGEGGADSAYNIVILSPLIHRMMHYAKVEGLDLTKISKGKLPIKINGANYVITWHPDHAKIVESYSSQPAS